MSTRPPASAAVQSAFSQVDSRRPQKFTAPSATTNAPATAAAATPPPPPAPGRCPASTRAAAAVDVSPAATVASPNMYAIHGRPKARSATYAAPAARG